MIECCRCHCEITKDLMECLEVDIVGEDLTDIKPDGNVWRFCLPCWDQIITFLAGEGMLI